MNTWLEAEPRPQIQYRGPSGPPRRKLRRTWPQRFLLTLGSLGSVVLLLLAGVIFRGLQHYRAISVVSMAEVEAAPPGEPSNWLLVGSDSRDGIDPDDPNAGIFIGAEAGGKRTDTIMVARVDPGAGTVDLLSVPRDLWVPISGKGGSSKINSAFNGEGGAERLVATVEDFLDIEINNYAEVNFQGFQSVVDSLGGVPIWFETPVRDTHSALNIPESGCHLLGGFEALAFARSRYLQYQDSDGDWKSDPFSDLSRNSRQQFLLSRLADQASAKVGSGDLGAIDGIIAAGGENLTINDGTGAGAMIDLARSFAGVGSSGLRTYSLPVFDEDYGEVKALGLNEDEARPVLDVFRGILAAPDPNAFPSPTGADRSTFTVQVLNGAGREGLAGEASDALAGLGFEMVEASNARKQAERSVILYPAGAEGAATELGRVLRVTPTFEADDTVDQLTLVAGADYDGVIDISIAGVTVESTVVEAPPPVVETEHVGYVPGPGPEGTPCWFPT